ncbi:ATP-dependent DNA helicase PcrA [Priestia megaterium Q3]|uniref:DNA 3'-5' helicase n=1 Tax=Priestia megaterium Q3 TaxID=1452722 RepID=A0A806TJS5_PRIMG|nr:UvrD-helicase domain-containing protein [Priestia megaterium]AKP78620.1 ATP-dependent DNA helicase PcrA [Priestia megaterium Q3]
MTPKYNQQDYLRAILNPNPMRGKSGWYAEEITWEVLKRTFKNRVCLAYWSFPIFLKSCSGNFLGRREADILLIDKQLGITVIEVKGIRINQIRKIQGHKWLYEDFYREEGNPYQQAENQLDSLLGFINKKKGLSDKISRRVLIALPYITRAEWKERGFDSLPSSPPILFKEDLADERAFFNKISSTYLYRTTAQLDENEWRSLTQLIHGEGFSENYKLGELEMKYAIPFSKLYILSSEEQFWEEEKSICQALDLGTKVILLTYFSLPQNWLEKYRLFRNKNQLLSYECQKTEEGQEKVSIQDGENLFRELEEKILKDFPSFNLGQYKAASWNQMMGPLKLGAGAGVGKTRVIIERILFLLAKGVSLKDIIMITFTNNSTNEMKERLQEKLISLFKLTSQAKYINWAEDVNGMQISTIHSFAKNILVELSHELGYGRNVKLRSFTKEKKDIIEQLANEYFELNPVSKIIRLGFTHYELTNIIYSFWDVMEKRGLTKNEIKELDWGKAESYRYGIIQDLFRYVFLRCENCLDIEKKRENAVSIGDLVRKLKEFSQNKDKMKQLPSKKFLLIDEAQDIDNPTVEMIASLANYLDYQLFVVGDVKQSIYRFRGSDYKSFDLLDAKIKREKEENPIFRNITLHQNYRTSISLLNKLDRLFADWGRKGWLPYSEEDRLVGVGSPLEKDDDLQFIEVKNSEQEKAEVLKAITESLAITKGLANDKNGKVALIVRTNAQAETIRKWCEAANIPTLQNLHGTFYTSDAVRDFKYLLDGLLYPNEAKYLINALQTPYFRYNIPYQALLQFSGDDRKISEFIHRKIGDDFIRYVELLKTLPIMAVIQKIISEKGMLRQLSDFYKRQTEKKSQKKLDVEQYKKNLFHLMNIIQQQFDTMNGTLFALHEWLTLQIRTNRSENEPMIELPGQKVEVATVHSSKGLEYHTVIIPKTDHPFERESTAFHIEEEIEAAKEKRKVGWCLKGRESNNYYSQLSVIERDEIIKEEVRLLYVSMTRSKERLLVILPEQDKRDTWSSLIKATGIKEVRNGR